MLFSIDIAIYLGNFFAPSLNVNIFL